MRARLAMLPVAVLAVTVLAACSGVPLASHADPTATPTATPVPSPTPRPTPESWLHNSTLLTIYGRGFGIAPILGRLGMDGSFNDMARQIQPFVQGIRSATGNSRKPVRVAVHLIYGLATPCNASRNCLYYLDDSGVNIVKQYILPAQKHGWLVILDDQLGLSNPVAEVRRMLAKGYLRYDNVEVALDPEFRTAPGQPTPGIPVGSITAAEINAAAGVLNHYGFRWHLRHHKILIAYQFQWGMIQNRQALRGWPHGYVDPVIVADGFGTPGVKAKVYSTLLGPRFRRIRYRGIKLFYPNPYEQANHFDSPLMTWPQVFGQAPAYYENQRYAIWPPPSVVVIA